MARDRVQLVHAVSNSFSRWRDWVRTVANRTCSPPISKSTSLPEKTNASVRDQHLWAQVIAAFSIVLAATLIATERTAWRLSFQPELGRPWFALLNVRVYQPPAFFWWWL